MLAISDHHTLASHENETWILPREKKDNIQRWHYHID